MPETVRAVLTASARPGNPGGFPLYDLGPFIESLSPASAALCFQRRSALESVLDIELEFNELTGAASAELFREVLIRIEPAVDFECSLPGPGVPTPYDEDWSALDVRPDVACLPSGKPLAVALPLLEAVPAVFRQADLTNSVIAYRVTLDRTIGSLAHARPLVPALAEVSRRGIGDLEAPLSDAVRLLRGDGWSAHEQICMPAAARMRNGAWVEAILRKHLRQVAPFVPDDLLPLAWDAEARAPAEATLQEYVARLRDESFLTRMLGQIAAADSGPQLLMNGRNAAIAASRSTSPGDYAFISYAHRNAAFVDSLVGALTSAGAKFWIDSGIDAGARWDETLEERIRNCGVLIACVCDDYQASKYCRRELKFADLINKPIVPVAPSISTWQPGLQMMFQELQVAAFDEGRGFPHVRRALEVLAPHVFQ
jgi:hypothetical protein